MMVGMRADRALGWQIECCTHNRLDLTRLENMRCWPRTFASSERVHRRDLMPRILSIEEDAEAPHCVIPGPRPVGRRSRGTPVVDPTGADETISMRLSETR